MAPGLGPPLEESRIKTAAAAKKRRTPDRSDVEAAGEPVSKRRRMKEGEMQLSPTEYAITTVSDSRPSFNEEPSHLLRRATAIVLEHIGFDGATKEALESLCGEVETCKCYCYNKLVKPRHIVTTTDATKFLSFVAESMLSARRSSPTPLDFEYALRREGLTARLLKPHLKPPVAASKVKPLFISVPQQELVHRPFAALTGEDLSGDSDKRIKAYIPKQFPTFPSKHTYKSTEVKLDRETDPRKIREKAAEEARHGEEALRRLVKAGKAGDHRSARRAAEKSAKQKKRHEMWEDAMAELATVKLPINSSSGGDNSEEQIILVNAENPYMRKPAPRLRGVV